VERDKIPQTLIMRCCDVIEQSASRSPALTSRAAVRFLAGPAKMRGVSAAAPPCNSISAAAFASVIVMIPTGSEDFDRDLIIAAYKNGTADIDAIDAT
jgi:hypothetical protein